MYLMSIDNLIIPEKFVHSTGIKFGLVEETDYHGQLYIKRMIF